MNWEETRILKDEVLFSKKDMDDQAEASFRAGVRHMVRWIVEHDYEELLPWTAWEELLLTHDIDEVDILDEIFEDKKEEHAG